MTGRNAGKQAAILASQKISGEGGASLGGEHLAAIFVGKAFGEVCGEPAECASTREIGE
jgi:hypothetical protein